MARQPKTYRRHGDMPAYFQGRDGRPAWIPSQGLRSAGWRRCDLKDAEGAWLTLGQAIDRAALINDAVGLWREGRSVPTEHAAYAPAGACAADPAPRLAEDRFSIGALMDAWAGVKAPFRGGQAVAFTSPPSEEFQALRRNTQLDYHTKLKRLLDVLSGWPVPPARDADPADRARYAVAIAETRADSIFALQADEDATGLINDPLREAYRILRATSGDHMASGVMAVAGAWLSWCRVNRSRRIHNWAAEVKRVTPSDRIRVATLAELQALIAAAEAAGYPSIAHSIVLGVDLTWSQADRLALTWNRVVADDDGRVRCFTPSQLTDGPKVERVGRVKTGRIGGTPLLSFGARRLAAIRQAHAAMDAHPTHVLICETTGAPWKADHYRHTFAEIRAEAVKIAPSCVDLTDQDLRDTGVTWCRIAGLTIEETCSRTLQSRRRVLDLWDRSYGEIGPETADPGADRLEAWLTGQLAKHKAAL